MLHIQLINHDTNYINNERLSGRTSCYFSSNIVPNKDDVVIIDEDKKMMFRVKDRIFNQTDPDSIVMIGYTFHTKK